MDKDTFTNKLKEIQKHSFQMGLISETEKYLVFKEYLKNENTDISTPVSKLMLEFIESIDSKILEHDNLITEIENELEFIELLEKNKITFDVNKLKELQKLNFHIGGSSKSMELLNLEEDKMSIESIKRKILEYGELITEIENDLIDSIHKWE